MVDENVVSMVFKKLNLFGNSTHGFDFRKKPELHQDPSLLVGSKSCFMKRL